MTTESESMTTAVVATVLTGVSIEGLEQFVNALSTEQTAELALRVDAIGAICRKAKAMAYGKLIVDGFLDQTYTDFDGTAYRFERARRRKITDYEGLLADLEREGLKMKDLAKYLSKSDAFKVGALSDDPKTHDAADDWAEWVDETPRLVELDAKGRPQR